MVKNIHTKVTDEMYYELLSKKVKLRLDSWIELFDYILKQPDSPIGTPPQKFSFDTVPQNQITLPKWFTEKNLATLKSMLNIPDDASEQAGEISLHLIQSRVNGWKKISDNGDLEQFRRYRAEQKAKAQAQEPDVVVGDEQESQSLL